MKTMSAMLMGFACAAMLLTSCATAQEAAPAAAKGRKKPFVLDPLLD